MATGDLGMIFAFISRFSIEKYHMNTDRDGEGRDSNKHVEGELKDMVGLIHVLIVKPGSH